MVDVMSELLRSLVPGGFRCVQLKLLSYYGTVNGATALSGANASNLLPRSSCGSFRFVIDTETVKT